MAGPWFVTLISTAFSAARAESATSLPWWAVLGRVLQEVYQDVLDEREIGLYRGQVAGDIERDGPSVQALAYLAQGRTHDVLHVAPIGGVT